jgi:hypothetical protein
MTVQGVRSKDRFVRLEPFFRKAPVAPNRHPAAGASDQAARAAATFDSKRTETRLETPDSSMVTP